jgi:hypothetical protein
MKSSLVAASLFTILIAPSCKDKTAGVPAAGGKTSAGVAPEKTAQATEGEYFKFTIDGKPQQIAADDVSTTFNPSSEEFKVYAGKDGGLSLTLTIPKMPSCPCSVPAGAAPGNVLSQGSVSLQNFPSKPLVFNNWYNGLAGTPAPDAIKISDLGTLANGSRYISGTVSTTVLKTESNGDSPDNVDHVVVGSFRVKLNVAGAGPF